MTWSHDGEVPVIDRYDFGQPVALGDGNNRRVREESGYARHRRAADRHR